MSADEPNGANQSQVVPPSDALAVVGSEFAEVAIGLDHSGNGLRLKLVDLHTGRERLLDALELETIVWLRDEHLGALLDPSSDRWRDAGKP